MLQAREHALTSCFSVVFNLGLTFESLEEFGSASWNVTGQEGDPIIISHAPKSEMSVKE
jgi:hypothetical protein